MYIIVQYCARCGKVFRQRTCNPKGRKYCSDQCRYNRKPPADPPVPDPQ